MKILVVGGTGFLGSEIVQRFLEDGHQLRSLSRKKSRVHVDQWIGDIGQPASYKDLISNWKPEVVIQTAWVTDQLSYRNSEKNPIYAKNSVEFAEHCFQSDVKHFVALGTSAEYGRPNQLCNAASTPSLPLDLYSADKLWTFANMKKIVQNYETRFSWARIFQPYGKNQDPNRLIPSAAKNFKEGKKFTTQSSENVLDWITSRDIAGAVSYIIKHDLPEVLDIGTSVGTSVGAVLNEVARQCGVDESYIEKTITRDQLETPLELVVNPKSPLLAHGWKPKDNLHAGLSWALSL